MPGTETDHLRLIDCGARQTARPALLDMAMIDALRGRLGAYGFDELFEDATFEVTERLSAIEAAMAAEDYGRLAQVASRLGADAASIGLIATADVARDLSVAAEARDGPETSAIALRLLRIGEDSLIAAAPLTVAKWQDSSSPV